MNKTDGTTISDAWVQLTESALAAPRGELSPTVVSFGDFSELTDPDAWREVDATLEAEGTSTVETIANTIFPWSVWMASGRDRATFYSMYKAILPRIRAAEPHLNRGGVYFERLIRWEPDDAALNQLEFIISRHKPGRRRTAYQASVFDPRRDHTAAARQGFPCLQHLTFLPDRNGLHVNAFYASQRLYDKALGNYVGISRLGTYVAEVLGLDLVRVTCFIGVAKLGVAKDSPSLRQAIASLASR